MKTSALAILSAFLIVDYVADSASIGTNSAVLYLSQYGYLLSGNMKNSENIIDEDKFKAAVAEFQSFAGLNITGEMDDETAETMTLPRCGVKDKVGPGSDSRSRRYALQGSRWKVKNLRYKIAKYPKKLKQSDVDKEVHRAFLVWSDYTDLTFTPTKGQVHIEIRFESGEHGDGDPFDGPGGTLAHAYFPVFGGDVHFDASEQWTIGKFQGTNLFQVAAHEFGHSLGLSHSDIKTALMAPFYRGFNPAFQLDEDDIQGIQTLYGTKTTKTPSFGDDDDDDFDGTNNGSPSAPKPTNHDDSTLCKDGKFDTIFNSAEGHTYVFKGSQYWRLTEDNIAEGYPKLISHGWPGLPGDIDAAFTYKNGKSYFFKGKQYWRYVGRKMDGFYPKDISDGFTGIPDDIDAAMIWSGNGKIYFFKGSKFWRFDPQLRPPVKSTYPKQISNWESVPDNLDAVFQYTNGYTYFFKDGAYYRFNDVKFSVERAKPAFPRSTAYWWFGCSSAPQGTIGTRTKAWLRDDEESDDEGSDTLDADDYHTTGGEETRRSNNNGGGDSASGRLGVPVVLIVFLSFFGRSFAS